MRTDQEDKTFWRARRVWCQYDMSIISCFNAARILNDCIQPLNKRILFWTIQGRSNFKRRNISPTKNFTWPTFFCLHFNFCVFSPRTGRREVRAHLTRCTWFWGSHSHSTLPIPRGACRRIKKYCLTSVFFSSSSRVVHLALFAKEGKHSHACLDQKTHTHSSGAPSPPYPHMKGRIHEWCPPQSFLFNIKIEGYVASSYCDLDHALKIRGLRRICWPWRSFWLPAERWKEHKKTGLTSPL